MYLRTKVFQANPILSVEELDEAALLLKGGDLVGIPTETVYGLAADLFQEDAVQKIFRTKGRPSDNPLIAHIGHLSQLAGLVSDPSDWFFRLSEQFWPGPLTLIAPRGPLVSDRVAAKLSTVAIRMPSHPCALQLLQRVGPLAAPSANLSGKPSPTEAGHVLEDFETKIPLIIDGGASSLGIESTVISTVGKEPVLLRPGAISREEIEACLGVKLQDPIQGQIPQSPGMKYRHYAPKAKVFLVDTQEELEKLQEAGAYAPSCIEACNLYAELRQADRLQSDVVAIYLTNEIRSNEALMNRLDKASTNSFISL